MNILNETELMNNQKATTYIVPDKQFEALQTPLGNSLLFSIGTDNIFFCTCETPGDTHGWVRVDISTALSQRDFNGQPIVAKTFDLGQDPSTGNIDLVLVVIAEGKDWLYISLGNSTETWNNYAPQWTQLPFDDGQNKAFDSSPISDVYVARFGANQFVFADIITNPNTQTISRYTIDPTKHVMQNTTGADQAWIPHGLAMDVQAGTAINAIGCGTGDQGVNGIYTLGSVNGDAELEYASLFDANNAGGPVSPTNFDMKKLADGTALSIDSAHMAIAVSAPGSDGTTDLFFATNGSLYFIAGKDQLENNNVFPQFTRIYTHSLLQNVTSLHINNWNNQLVLWGQSISTDGSGASQIFIMECTLGSETEGAANGVNGTAWTCPIAILYGVENSATYINNQYGNSVLFAHQADGSLVHLFEDPITTAWQQRSLLTTPLNQQTIIYKTPTYSTHIAVTDDNNVPQLNLPVLLWASSPCSVYINDATNADTYFTLDTVKPLSLETDVTGNITIMQPVDTIGGISYFVAVQDATTKKWYSEAINPLTGTVNTLQAKVPDANDHLANVTVTDERGITTPLVNTATFGSQTGSTSSNIYKICQNKSSLNQDGLAPGQSWPTPGASVSAAQPALKQPLNKNRLAKNLRFNAEGTEIWGSSFGKNSKHYEGIEAMKAMGVTLQADGTLAITLNSGKVLNSTNSIEVAAGNFYKWMQHEAHKVDSLIMTLINDEIDCLITIAEDLYHFVLKCANDIANLVHSMLNAIETAFADIVKWLGTIFAWNDIVRTHKVLESFFRNYATYCISNIDGVKAQLNYAASETIKAIDTWAGLPDNTFPTDSYSSQSSSNPPSQGQHKPSSSWGHRHLKSNASASDYSDTADAGNLLDDLFKGITTEFTIVTNAVDQIKDILSEIGTMPLGDILKRLVAIIADLLIESAVNLTDTLLTAAEDIVSDIVTATFIKPVNIPVLSDMYKMFADEELSLLGLSCLLIAIPLNVIYKITHNGQAPFPDNDATTALQNATTLKDFMLAMPNAVPSLTQEKMLQDNSPVWSDKANNFWNLIGNSCALGGSLAVSLLGALKIAMPSSKAVATFYGVFYLPYVAPNAISVVQNFYNPSENWYNYMGLGLAAAGLIKSFVDIKLVQPAAAPVTSSVPGFMEPQKAIPKKLESVSQLNEGDDSFVLIPPNDPGAPVESGNPPAPTPGWSKPFQKGLSWNDASPFVEAIINLAWEVPVVFAYLDAEKANTPYNKKTHINNILNCTGNTMFNFGGLISPFSTFGPPPANKIVAGVQAVMNLGYGAMVFATSADLL